MNIKINHGINNIIIDFDMERKKVSIVKDRSDEFLRNIFANKNYEEYEKWFIHRFGGKYTINEIIDLLGSNAGVSAVDNIRISII